MSSCHKRCAISLIKALTMRVDCSLCQEFLIRFFFKLKKFNFSTIKREDEEYLELLKSTMKPKKIEPTISETSFSFCDVVVAA